MPVRIYTKRRFVTSHYHCLYVCKNDKLRRFFPESRFRNDERTSEDNKAWYQDMGDVWVIPREYWNGDIKTPTKLPYALLEKILQYSSQPGDVVLDPFLGSGQVAVVAKQLKRHYIGFETSLRYTTLLFAVCKRGLQSKSCLYGHRRTCQQCVRKPLLTFE
ncbi:MAG: DNA-methyltransferase [Armatimonadota bacterium]